MSPIGDQVVAVGSRLTIDLTAVDPEKDPLTFSASPVPLPENTSLNSLTGVFTFIPALRQVGVLALTFIVSDGVLAASETINITVNGPPAGGVTELIGRILDTNDIVLGTQTPVVGATVSLLNTGVSTISDINGDFTLTRAPSGNQILDIETSTANLAPDGSTYAGFREEIELIANVTNVVDRPFFLPRIDSGSLTTVHPNSDTVVNNPTLGTTMSIPPNAAKNPDGTNFTGQISISEVPEGLAPASLPEGLEPGLLLTIQPVGVTFATPIPLTAPNIDNMPPGSELDFLSLDPETGLFKVVGTGRVSADGSVIETISGGIVSATWHCYCPPDGDSNTDVKEKENKVQDPTKSCQAQKFGSTATLRSGCLGVDFSLPSHRSLGVSRSLRFVYQSLRAHPQPVIPFDATISLRAAVPPQISYQLSVAGIEQGTETFVDSSGLNENIDETIRVNASFDGSGFETGLYPYTVRLTSNYLASRVATILDDEILVINEQSSLLGAGWGIEGLAKLHLIDANSVLLVSGEGGAILFSGGPTAFTPPAGDFSTLVNKPDGTFTRTLKDGTQIHFDSQGLQRSVVDRNGNTTSFAYDGQGHMTSITDPAGLTATLGYTGGHLSSVTDPAARTTSFDHDTEGNLIKVIFPDSSFRSFGYDSRHLMTSETDERNFTNQREYDSLGRLVQATLADGSIRSTTNSQTVGSVDLSTGVGTPANPAPVVRPADAVNSFTDANGNQQTIETDRFGAATRITDALGRTTLIERSSGNNGNLIAGATFDQGQVGQAFSLEGPADQVLIGNSANLQLQDFTLTAWIRLSTLSLPAGGAGIFAYGQNGYGFFVAGPSTGSGPGGLSPIQDRELLLSKIGSNAVSSQGVAIPDTNFHHVAVTKSGGKVVFYLDGVGFPVPISYDPGFSFNTDIAIGNRPDGFPNDFPGLIDEVQIFKRDLSAEEIESIFAIGSSGNRTTPLPGLLSSWQAEGDAIDIAGNHGLPTRITRANGSVTTMTYDALGNLLTSTEEAIGATTTFTYESVFNQLTSITDPEGNSTTIHYDSNGNPIEIIDALGTRTTMAYANPNCAGQFTSVTTAAGGTEENTTTFHYDPITCNLSQTTDPLLSTTTLAYDNSGNVVQSTDAEGRTTRFQYDGLNRLIQIIAANSSLIDPACGSEGVTCYQYDDKGNLTQVTDARDSVTIFEHDSEDRLIKTTSPLGNSDTFIHDANGNLLSTTDRNGQTIDFQYDTVNQPVRKTWAPGTSEKTTTTFTYDAVGNLTSATDSDSALTMAYDPLSRLTSASSSGSFSQPDVSISYTYDKNGNRLSMTDPTGLTRYHYDPLNRPTDLTNPSVQTTSFDYNALSRRIQLSLPNGVTTRYVYDDAGQLLNLAHQLGAGTISDFFYTYDKVGNRTSLTQQRSLVTVNPTLDYTYDELNRLVEATHSLPTNPLETFDYDSVGNRLLREGQAFSAILDAANRLLEDEDFCYAYDLNGNLRSKEAKVAGVCSGAGQLTEYDYDPDNQLIEVRINGTPVGSYRYDGLGRRIEKETSGTITQYVYDNEDILLEFDGNAVPGPVDVVYDLAADWSDTINPNDPWSYNSAPGASILTHFDDWDSLNLDFTSDQPAWAAAQSPTVGHIPAWFKTASPTISTDLPIGTVGVHGSDPFNAVPFTDAGVSWTSPADGDVAISGGLWLARKTLGRSMDWRLKINGTLISDGSLTSTDSFTSVNPFDFAVGSGGAGALNFPVVAGDVIDLEVVQAPASPFAEFVGINLAITETVTTVPPLARYTHGPGIDEPLIMERDLDSSGTFENGECFYYQADGLGSVTGLTDSEGAVAQSYVYDSFGQIVQQLGALPNPYTYTGRELDEETGLYHYRARYYHPDSGRFTTEDPIAFLGGINFYVMTQNSPTNWVDPWGLWRTAGHRTLTTAAMKRAGFSTFDIDIANKANRSVDNVTNWFNDPEHYMPGTGAVAEMFIEKNLNEAVEKALAGDRQGALEALGKGLHPVQDKWSHQMQNAGWMAHNPFGQNADSVKDHIAEYASALKGTQDYVKRFLQGVGGICAFNAKAE